MPINGAAQQNNHILGEFVHCIVQEDVETCFAMVIKSKKRGICEFKFFQDMENILVLNTLNSRQF